MNYREIKEKKDKIYFEIEREKKSDDYEAVNRIKELKKMYNFYNNLLKIKKVGKDE